MREREGEGGRGGEREKCHNVQKFIKLIKRENGKIASLSMLFHFNVWTVFLSANTGHLLVYGLRYHSGSHGRQTQLLYVHYIAVL